MDSNNSSRGFPIPSVCSSDLYRRLAQLVVAVTLILVIVTNLLTLLVTWHAINSLINPFFFVSLAMSSLLTGVFVLPFNLAFAARSDAGVPGHVICTFSGSMFHILQTVSLFSFFALSLDRLVSINFPLKYHDMLTREVNVALLLFIWLVPTLMYGLIPATGIGEYVYKCWQSMCNLGLINLNYLNALMLLSVTVFLTTYAINGRIFYLARRQQAKLASLQEGQNPISFKKFKSRLRAAGSIMMALGMFTLCLGPYYAMLFSVVLFNAAVTPVTEFVLLWIAISNNYMNFFVFLATYRSFHMHFMRLVGLDERVRAANVTIVSGISNSSKRMSTFPTQPANDITSSSKNPSSLGASPGRQSPENHLGQPLCASPGGQSPEDHLGQPPCASPEGQSPEDHLGQPPCASPGGQSPEDHLGQPPCASPGGQSPEDHLGQPPCASPEGQSPEDHLSQPLCASPEGQSPEDLLSQPDRVGVANTFI